jgi:hypothetical protein
MLALLATTHHSYSPGDRARDVGQGALLVLAGQRAVRPWADEQPAYWAAIIRLRFERDTDRECCIGRAADRISTFSGLVSL